MILHMTGYAGSRDYVGNLQSPWRTPHRSTHPTEKQDSDPLVADSDLRVASSVHRTPAQNSQREGRSPVFQWDVWISVGSSTEIAGFRDPAYPVMCTSILYWECMHLMHMVGLLQENNIVGRLNQNQSICSSIRCDASRWEQFLRGCRLGQL